MIYAIYTILSGLFIFFLVFPFWKVVCSSFFKEKINPKTNKTFDYANIITAYGNVDIAKPLVMSLLHQTHKNHHIYLVADNCDIDNWDIQHEQLTLLHPQPSLNLKAKSIIHAVENAKRQHDYVIIFDADNVAHPNFLEEINCYANAGHRAIQGQRTAKNLDTKIAAADALGEFYKNYVERYIPYLIGSSSVISGSGMAVEWHLYKAYLDSPEIQKGKELWKKMLQEDKILQNFLLRRKERIAYAWNAIVYDEKVSTAEAVETQRSRWLYSYFQNFPNALGLIFRGLTNFNWNQILFGIITIAPPLFILLGLSGIMMLLGIFIAPIVALTLAIAIAIFTSNIFLVLYLSKVPPAVWQSLASIPLFIWKQATALLKMSNPNKNFKHTEHKHKVDVEELIKRN